MIFQKSAVFCLIAVVIGLFSPLALEAEIPGIVLLEAESFDVKGLEAFGSWVVDQQFMDQMGSPFLMAHGLGMPCEDATRQVTFPETGKYRVWVRTRNWVSNWGHEEGPGQFKLLVNGKALQPVFGKTGGAWHWQDGGTVEINTEEIELTLRDLTGFNGRCDAIVFAKDPGFEPPNELKALGAFRKRALGLPAVPPDAGHYDFVVVGGGMAGTAAAVSAARLGVKVALIQNRPVLGGNSSSEVRVSPGGEMNRPPYPNLGNLVREIAPAISRGNAHEAALFEDDKKEKVVAAEENIDLFLNTHAHKVEMDGDKIEAVVAKNIKTSKELRFPARLFADCTGDGTIGFLAGADFRMGRESKAQTDEPLAPEEADKMTMGTTVMWRSREVENPAPFPECPWAVQFTEQSAQRTTKAEWFWETGMELDQIEDFEQVRDHGLRAAFGNWDFLKNKSEGRAAFANRELEWVAYVGGKRESRRLLGDVILKEQDVMEQREFPDASVTCTWSIDLHYPDPDNTKFFPGEEFLSVAHHERHPGYPIPYRCFYSRNIENLFMAGRDISVTHVALGTVRVMRTTGMMGEVVGMAAAICKDNNTLPRGVYEEHLDKLIALMKKGTGAPPPPPVVPKPPEWLPRAGENLALTAKVQVSGFLDEEKYPASYINDGKYDIQSNAGRWVSDRVSPATAELTWEEPKTFNAVRILTGQRGNGQPQSAIINFSVQYHTGQRWQDIPGARDAANMAYDWHAEFDPVTASRVRLVVNITPGDLARIWEMEIYNVAGLRE